MKLHNTVALCIAALCAAIPVRAQEVWIGRPTIGDVVRHQFGQAVQAQQQAVRSKAQFNADIAQARKDFFATAAKPEARAEAEKRFAGLLLGKDYVFLAGLIAEGTGKTSRQRNDAMHALTGGELDGGIAPPARRAFDGWVNAVRTSLGARSPDELLFVTSSDKVLATIRDSVDSYEAYKLLRDKLEIDRFTTARSIGEARLAPGTFRLHEAQHGPLDVMRDMRIDLLGQTRPLRARLSELAKSGQAVLRCAYGPKDGHADGTAQYEHIFFWFKTPPDGIDDLLAEDTARGMARLRTRTARAECPENSALAKAIFDGGETAGRAHAAKTPKQLEQDRHAAMLAAGEAQRAAAAAEGAARAERLQAERAAADRARQAQLDAIESRQQAQRNANAERQQAQRDAAGQRRCAASQAHLERANAQFQATPPQHAARYELRLQTMQQRHAQLCGGG